MTDRDDQWLVRQCLGGNSRAFEVLVDRYEMPIYNVILKMVRNEDDAADLTQTAFVKAFEKLHMYKPRYKFFSWFYRMAFNESLNFINQRRNLHQLEEGIHSTDKSPLEQLDESDREEAIQDGLMILKPELRIVIVLRHFQELSYREISQILEVPEKKIKSRLFEARNQLRRILSRKGL